MPKPTFPAAAEGLPTRNRSISQMLNANALRGMNLEETVRYHVQAVKDAMEFIHGGKWQAWIDHETCQVCVMPFADQGI